jgi:hypothetical protein
MFNIYIIFKLFFVNEATAFVVIVADEDLVVIVADEDLFLVLFLMRRILLLFLPLL